MINLYARNEYRVANRAVMLHFGWAGDDTCGMFSIPSCIDKRELKVIASCGGDWEHVSVSRTNRCSNWYEMAQIKRLFFHDEEVVMQLHVPSSEHVSDHDNCLHLWRPTSATIPVPPKWMVGGMSKAEAIKEAAKVMP